MPTNTSLMCNNHSLTTLTPFITQAVIVQYIKSGPTNAILAPFNYIQFGTFRSKSKLGRKGSAENITGPKSDQTNIICFITKHFN